MALKQLKDKKCRWCKQLFIPAQSLQVVCTPQCALAYSKDKKQKAFKAETRAMKKALLDADKAHWAKRAKDACHAYIRERDKLLPCVSCGRHHEGQYHAGHYRPSGVNSSLRYDDRNIHKQCAPCNNHKSGNVGEYRRYLVGRIGVELVEWLDNNHDVKRWTIDELKQIESDYRAKLKALK